MARDIFAHTDADLLPILEELRAREPIFHRPAFAATADDFAAMTAPNYWEVGASGRRYSRDFILQTLADSPPIDAATANWRVSGFALRALGSETFLVTYTLKQGARFSRRSTIWRRSPEGWQILFHQGTLVSADQDDVVPA
jgi:hypothetical protein